MKYAPYSKQIISTLIDMIIVYTSFLIIRFFNADLNRPIVLIGIASFYETLCHYYFQKTVGEKLLGLRIIFNKKIIKETNKIIRYGIRAWVRSVMLFSFYIFSIIHVMGFFLLLLYLTVPLYRERRNLVWDVVAVDVSIIECSGKTLCKDEETASQKNG